MTKKLVEYNKKRNFDKTHEPRGRKEKNSRKLRFVVQHHIARKDHYDLRLEWDGVLKSWAVPKGPSYNPKDKSLNISEANYHGTSVSAHAIVAHEFGHAMQDAKNYAPLKIRQFVIKTSNFVSKLLMPLLILGILLQIFLFSSIAGSLVIYISVALYGVSVIASLVTLPVEYNASSRAKKILIGMGSVSEDEVKGTDAVLNAAALTYVASLLLSLAYFLRFLFLLLAIRDR